MRITLDENLPGVLATTLATLDYDVDTVVDERLGGYPDRAVWRAAQADRRFLVTQDLDFAVRFPTAFSRS